jgi:hypothetical protein
MKRLRFAVLALIATLPYGQDRTPLKEFRARFLNQRVIVNANFSTTTASYLLEWHFAKEKKGVYEINYSKDVPSTFAGRTGTIIVVQAPAGEPSQEDGAYVKWAEAIVRLESGELLLTTLFSTSTGTESHESFALVSAREKQKQQNAALAENLQQKLKGSSLYLTAYTKVYDEGFNPKTEDLALIKHGLGHSEALITTAPLLTSLPVLDVHYFDALDYTQITLQLPSGQKVLYILGCVADTLRPNQICASTSMPPFLTPAEVQAIRNGSIFIGMSEAALYLCLGSPERSNEAVAGTTQLIYASSYIYIKDKVIVEIQSRH